jgi:glycosyltransferase involved in cell wall biosynthesis
LTDSDSGMFRGDYMATMKDKVLVSVIIPVYNGERYLVDTIESIRAQNHQSLEVIVVDDGSTDGSARIACAYGSFIRYYHQPNLGTAAAMNRGTDVSYGEYLAFLAADDLWTENRLKVQLNTFVAHPEVDIVSGHVQQFLSPDIPQSVRQNIRYSDGLIAGHVIPAMLIKRSSFFRVGLFEPQWKVGAEMSWYLRAREAGLAMLVLPDLVLLRRIHANNKGITRRSFIKQRTRILKAALDRRIDRSPDR